jgi:O-antigen/teichoic acid export membrane protein
VGWTAAVRDRLTVSRRGFLSIVTGSAAGQLLALAVAPLLFRLYRPEEFGTFMVISTLAVTIGTVAALRFEMAVPLAERERDAHALVILGLGAAGATAIVGTLVVAVAGDSIAGAFDQPRLRPWLWTVPPVAAAMGMALVLNQLAVRQRRYGAVGRRAFFQSATVQAAQLGAGLAGMRSGGLVLGLGVGQIAGALVLLRGSGLDGPAARTAATLGALRAVLRRYRRFPLLLAPSGLLNVLGRQLPILLMAYWYGAVVAGWLGLTQRVVAMPVALVGGAVAQVYLGELSRAARSDPARARSILLRASGRLALIAVPGALVLMIAAPAVFPFVFGAEWQTSGRYAQAMAVFMAAQFVVSPVSQTLVVFGRPGLQLAWDVSRLVLVTGAVAGTAMTGGSALAAIWSFAISSTVAYGVCWLMSLRSATAAGSTAALATEGTGRPPR